MKILHIIIGLEKGGAEGALSRLVRHNFKEQISHEVISFTEKGEIGRELEQKGFKVIALGMKSLISSPYFFFKLLKEIRTSNPDIIQTWMYHADLFGGLAAWMLGFKKIIWNVRTTDINQEGKILTKILRYFCSKLSSYIPSKIVCVAKASKKLHSNIGYSKQKLVVIPNGYSSDNFEYSEEKRKVIRKELGMADQNVIVGFVGKFHAVKGISNFINAAKILSKDFPNIYFMMVGRGLEKKNLSLCKSINVLGLTNKFLLVGETHDVVDYLSSMDIFALSSKTEGFPNALVEAMLIKLPCVTTDVGDARLIVNDCGIVVPLEDSAALAKGLTSLIKMPKDQRLRLGEQSCNRIKQNFSMENCANHYLSIYKELYN